MRSSIGSIALYIYSGRPYALYPIYVIENWIHVEHIFGN